MFQKYSWRKLNNKKLYKNPEVYLVFRTTKKYQPFTAFPFFIVKQVTEQTIVLMLFEIILW